MAKCVKESIEILRPRLKDGNLGEGFQIEGLEPITIEDIEIKRNQGFYVFLSNLRAYGAINFKIDKLRINVEKFKVDVLVDVPKIEAFGKYKLQMALGVLNLKGEGNMKANIGKKKLVIWVLSIVKVINFSPTDNIKLKISFAGPRYIKDGEEYVKVDKTEVPVKIVDLKLNFENLFPNDKNLNEVGNQLVNDNIDMFISDVEPALQRSLGEI